VFRGDPPELGGPHRGSGARRSSRTAGGLNPAPQARRVYPLRSYLFCTACGRRMFGNSKRQVAWYACAPKKAWRPDGHPVIFRVREDHLLDGLTAFLADQVFGQYRHSLLTAGLKTLSDATRQERASRFIALRGLCSVPSSVQPQGIEDRSLKTSMTGRAVAEPRAGSGVSEDMPDSWTGACGHVESPAGHHCCCSREAPGR
jgi:hypothetical protein